MIDLRQTGNRSHFRDAAMVDDERSRTLRKIIYKPVIKIGKLVCIPCCRSPVSNHAGIHCWRLEPWDLKFDIVAGGAHKLNLFIHGKAHRDRSLKRARNGAGDHTLEGTHSLPHTTRLCHALLRKMLAGLGAVGMAPDLEDLHDEE